MSEEPFSGSLEIVGGMEEIYEANSFSGDINKVEFDDSASRLHIDVKAGEGKFYLVK